MKFGTRSALTPAGWESMVALLDPLRLYDLSPESFVSRELMAYAAGLALFRQRLEQCRDDLFIATCSLERLARWEELLDLPILQPEHIKDTLHAYQMAKRCNEKRVMAEAVKWGQRGARINSISPGIIVTPLAVDEFNGPRGDFYKNMFANCPAGRPGTADEVANVAELLMSDKGAFITGADFLIDGGATASWFYGPLRPEK